jgi:phenylacetate-CoA ligase
MGFLAGCNYEDFRRIAQYHFEAVRDMGTIEIIRKFIESNRVLERGVREISEMLPLRLRYGISYGPTFRHWLAFLKESEKWDTDRLEAYQVEQLRDLLIHAGRNVPYYKRVFREYGFAPENVQSLDDIKALPYLDRKTIKENQKEFVATSVTEGRLISATTSGTTGIPIIVYGTKETEEKHWATIVDLWSRAGYHPNSRTIFFEANIREGSKENLPWKKYGNKLVLSSNYFMDEWIDTYIELINNFKPDFLIGFPHALATLSSYIKGSGKSISCGVKCAIVYAENVYDWQRELIREVFGARVLSDYGMVEKVIHGGGCELSDAYHIYPQYGLTEYLFLEDPLYELVGTGFINYAMPLIRYRTGDARNKMEKRCEKCGRNYEILPDLAGRVGDFLVDAEGRILSVCLTFDFRVFEKIRRFQLYQERPGKVEVRIQPADSLSSHDRENILGAIKRSLGLNGGRILFEVVPEGMERGVLGKYRMIDQRLDIKAFLIV